MSENPYASPLEESTVLGVVSGEPGDLRRIAVYQKGIIVCILLSLVVGGAQVVVPAGVQPVFALLTALVSVAGTIFVVLLALKVYGWGVGVLCGLVAIVPCIGLVFMLFVNAKATSVLQANGVRVGLLGADSTTLP